jgi:hypothetical protein
VHPARTMRKRRHLDALFPWAVTASGASRHG